MESASPAAHGGSKPAVPSNRRRGNRHRLNIPASLVAANESALNVTVTELSIGGVGIQSKTALKLEAVYHLNSFDTLIPPGMQVRIVSQRQSGNSGFEIGAKAL